MPLNLTGSATLSSLTLSSAGGDAGETLATLKLAISTVNTDAICAALGVEDGDALAWAWNASEDGTALERRYIRMGPITCDAVWIGKHAAEICGYRELRPTKVTVESVAPVDGGKWLVALKVQVKHPPAGAVECWAQFLGQDMRIDLQQDPDLFDKPKGDDNTSMTIDFGNGRSVRKRRLDRALMQ